MIRRPRIAVDGRALVDSPAGVGYYTRSLLLHLAQRGNLNLTAMSHRAARQCDELASAGVELETLTAPFGSWWQQRTLPRRLRKGDFDAFWSPVGTLPNGELPPAVVTVHDITPILFPYWHSWRNRVTFKRHLPDTLRSAARIVAVSQATAADLERRFPTSSSRITVVPNGVDPVFTPAIQPQLAAIRRSFDAPDGYALFVGTLEPRKNLPRLLDAWSSLRERMPNAPPLLIAGGKGWRSRGLRRRLQRSPGVRYLGRLDRTRLVEVLQGALLFVYPSLYEGFGLPVAEAMACGLPVITSNTSSLPEVTGEAGILINPQHTEELASAMSKLLTDVRLRSELGARARERSRRFSWDAAATRLEQVLLEVSSETRKE